MMFIAMIAAQAFTDLSPEVKACINECNSDVGCESLCLGIPNPSEADILEANQCIADCGNDVPCVIACQEGFTTGSQSSDTDTTESGNPSNVSNEAAEEESEDSSGSSIVVVTSGILAMVWLSQ